MAQHDAGTGHSHAHDARTDAHAEAKAPSPSKGSQGVDDGNGGGLPTFDVKAFYDWLVPHCDVDIRLEQHEVFSAFRAHAKLKCHDIVKIDSWDGTLKDILGCPFENRAWVTRCTRRDGFVWLNITTDWAFLPDTIQSKPPLPVFDSQDFASWCNRNDIQICRSQTFDDDVHDGLTTQYVLIRRRKEWPNIWKGTLRELTGYDSDAKVSVDAFNDYITGAKQVTFVIHAYRPVTTVQQNDTHRAVVQF